MRNFLRQCIYGDVFQLNTDRLLLRVVRPAEAKAVAVYLQNNRNFHAPFHPLHDERYFTEQEQRDYIRSDLRRFYDEAMFPFWITEIDKPEQIIGRVSFSYVIRGALSSCIVGYHLDQSFVGHGYMQEALKAGCSYIFREQKLHRIQADIMPANLSSIRTATACGFRKQGLNEKYMCIAGKWEDHAIYARLQDINDEKYYK